MKITSLQTFRMAEYPLSVFLKVETDSGLCGLGESTNQAAVVEAALHSLCAPAVLGRDPLCIEAIWNDLYQTMNYQGCAGAEVRALSALDIALWDLLGKSCNLPVYALLGGKVRDRVRIYNTCGSHGGRITGRADDQWFMQDAGSLAEDLLAANIRAMKIWPLDALAAETRGQHIRDEQLEAGMEPLRRIRQAVGGEMEIALECHSCWNLPSAIRIAQAAKAYGLKWLEDPLLVDDVDSLCALRSKISVPLLASERLFTRQQVLPLLKNHGADIVMVDLSWTGGLTEGKKIASLADAYRLPITTHNCGGPVLTRACAHFNLTVVNAIEMETVRAIYRTFPNLIQQDIGIENGFIDPGDAPGLGIDFKPSIYARDDIRVQSSTL